MWLESCAENITRLLHPEQEQLIKFGGCGGEGREIACLVVWGGLGLVGLGSFGYSAWILVTFSSNLP